MNYVLTVLATAFIALAQNNPVQLIELNGIKATLSISSTELTVGDSITVEVNALTNEQTQLHLITPKDGPFIVTNQSTLLDIPSSDGREWTWIIHLDTFDAKASSLNGLALEWKDESNNNGVIEFNAIPVSITSVAGDSLTSMELRDIKDSVSLFSDSNLIYIAIGASAILLIGIGVFVYLKRKNSPTIPADILALKSIDLLEQEDVDVHEFYTRLSQIVRSYIEQKFKIAVTGQTTREFLIAEKKNQRFEHQDRKALSDFLTSADMVKFAKLEPSKKILTDAAERAKDFIKKTNSNNLLEVAA